jgi:uracil-DNA glycosylase
MSIEFSQVVSDLHEQVLYLQELGVETLEAKIPQIAFSIASEIKVVANPTIEKYIPESPIFAPITPKITEVSKPNISRQSLLENSRLSHLPTLGNRPKQISNLEKTDSPIENREMPKVKTEPTLKTETLIETPTILPESNETLVDIQADIGDCKRCGLCEERKNIAHSKGSLTAKLMFIGEAPGADEDEQGEPFVGRAGQLLTKIIEGMGYDRKDVFIGNINRCRPPGNRQPTPAEVVQCKPFLLREISVVRPQVVVVMGNTACQNLLGTKIGISKIRGEFQDYYGVKVMPTFHPAYLLRDPHKKREVWEDMKKVRDYLAKTN